MSYHILEVKPYHGDTTSLDTTVGDETSLTEDMPFGPALYSIIKVDDNGYAYEMDNGYRSYEEAKESWPESK